MKRKLVVIIIVAISLSSMSLYAFINFKSKQEAKKPFVLLCEEFISKVPARLLELSRAETRSEINIPRAVINTALKDYISDLDMIKNYDVAVETLSIIKNADKTFTEYMKYKDKQALIESRNPYKLELEAINRLLPYVAARSLYDKAYEKSFLARAEKTQQQYEDYNSQTFKDGKIMEETRLSFENQLDSANKQCAIAKGIKQ